jgi:hypothetical protein
MEGPGRALGQAMTEGLDRPADVVDKLGAAIYQRLPRADDRHVGLALFAPVPQRIQELGIHSCQASQILGVDLIGLAPVGVDEPQLA